MKRFVTKNKLYMYSIVDSPLNGYKWVWLFVHGSLNAIFSNKGHSLHVRYQLIILILNCTYCT